MATYVIGDIHGCFDQLQALLEKIFFDPTNDTLWFTGDLVNGGPQSLETLRFVKNLGPKHICVMGNHDMALIAAAAGKIPAPKDRKIGIESVLNAPDCAELCEWLRNRPIAHYSLQHNVLLIHAGVLPSWQISDIQRYANELASVIQDSDTTANLAELFGSTNEQWSDQLTGIDRARCLLNIFTRMRFCTSDEKLDLTSKGESDSPPVGLTPWFKIPRHDSNNMKIVFGHWAALKGKTDVANIIAIDTGCVWGEQLTTLCLDNWQIHSVKGLLNPAK